MWPQLATVHLSLCFFLSSYQILTLSSMCSDAVQLMYGICHIAIFFSKRQPFFVYQIIK